MVADKLSRPRRRASRPPSLAQRRNDLTERIILEAGLALLERGAVATITMRLVADAARISERTVFRYFPTRDALLDGLAAEASRRIDPPPAPTTLAELATYPRRLYGCFEARAALTRSALHSEIFDRIRQTAARKRWDAVQALIDAEAPDAPPRDRRIAAANIRYFLSATAWNYHRAYFGFDLEESIACAEAALQSALRRVGIVAAGRARRSGEP